MYTSIKFLTIAFTLKSPRRMDRKGGEKYDMGVREIRGEGKGEETMCKREVQTPSM